MKLSFLSWALSLITQILFKGLGKGLNKLQHHFLGRNAGRLGSKLRITMFPVFKLGPLILRRRVLSIF